MKPTILRSRFVAAAVLSGTFLTSVTPSAQANNVSIFIEMEDQSRCPQFTHSLAESRSILPIRKTTNVPYLRMINFYLVHPFSDVSYKDEASPLADAETTPASDGGRAEQFALAAIGTLLLGGALASLSRPPPEDNEGPASLDED